MNHSSSIVAGTVFALALQCSGLISAATPLDDYVKLPDSSYSWKRTEQKSVDHGTAYHLELISQTWRGQFWSHHLQVFRPETVRNPGIALLYITADGEGQNELKSIVPVARRAGAVVAVLTKVPNQPLYDGRKEDALIAYTFDQYLRTGDETWPLLFPMVKSAVRAMDTIQAFAQQELGQTIERFGVTGASKRGWTTWLTGATDPRVKAIAPMVIDMLNMKAQLHWAETVYGHQSEQIHDYTELNLHQKLDDPPMQRLRSWVDPYAYRDRYTMPKLLLLGTNDPYWTVDSLHLYWDDLPEPKLVFQTPNAGHDLAGGKEAVKTLSAWFQFIADGQPLPRVDWKVQIQEQNATLAVNVDRPATHIRLWTADSVDRDFRDDKWTSRELNVQPASNGVAATVTIEKPTRGYRAFLAELELPSTSAESFKLSTEARVIPDNRR
jgi:PhoPQ-activated pathogenicity-related protein